LNYDLQNKKEKKIVKKEANKSTFESRNKIEANRHFNTVNVQKPDIQIPDTFEK
jgi:hypothetical protein